MYRRASDASRAVVPRPGWGTYLQGGCLVTRRLELNGRYSHLTPLKDSTAFVTGDEDAIGIGHYPREHNLKLQSDDADEPARGRRNHQIRSQLQ